MKLFYIPIILLSLLMFSCITDDDTNTEIVQITDRISMQRGILNFKSERDFKETLEDYYYNPSKMVATLNEYDFKNSASVLTLLEEKFANEEFQSKAELESFITQNSDFLSYNGEEVQGLYRMDYKNTFCNQDRLIIIGQYVYKYYDDYRYKLTLNQFNTNAFDKSLAEKENLKSLSTTEIVDLRSDVGGDCTDEFDGERIKCSADVDLETFFNAACVNFNFEFIAEAKNKFQRRVWGVWSNRRADVLRIDIDLEVQSGNGQSVLSMTDVRQSTNAYSTTWGSVDDFCVICANDPHDLEDYLFDFTGTENGVSFDCELSLNLGGTQNLCP